LPYSAKAGLLSGRYGLRSETNTLREKSWATLHLAVLRESEENTCTGNVFCFVRYKILHQAVIFVLVPLTGRSSKLAHPAVFFTGNTREIGGRFHRFFVHTILPLPCARTIKLVAAPSHWLHTLLLFLLLAQDISEKTVSYSVDLLASVS
jgi:hypothetical protein